MRLRVALPLLVCLAGLASAPFAAGYRLGFGEESTRQ